MQWRKLFAQAAVFQIELTNECPMTCQMCPRTTDMTRPIGFMPENLFRKIIDEAAGSTSKVFLHHFGESLLHPNLGEYIQYARKKGIKSYLSANPVLLNQKRIEAIVENQLQEIVLSLDGITSKTSMRVRGQAAVNVKLAERRVSELIKFKRARNTKYPKIIMQIVRQKQNINEINAWKRKWETVDGIAKAKVKSFIGWNGTNNNILNLRPDDQGCESKLVCDKPWTSVTILYDGRVVPCCFDHDGNEELGNIQFQTLDEICNGEAAEGLRQKHKDSDLEGTICSKCTDKEGYPVRKWFYPINRWTQAKWTLANEWQRK